MDLRREDGSHYKVNSLKTIRHGINRYLKLPPPPPFNRKVDIVYRQQHMGKGDLVQHPIISDTDLKSLY